MNFQITEDEYNRLHSVQRQLNMMARLFGEMSCFETPCAPEDLSEFFAAQEAAMDAVRKATDTRYEALRQEGDSMHWGDWCHALIIASGDRLHVPANAEKRIDAALNHMADIDPGYGHVLATWIDVTSRQAKAQGAKGQNKEATGEVKPSGQLSVELFADLMRAVSGQEMEPDELNETVREFLAAFHEEHPERAVITQALNAALMRNGYQWVLTCGQVGQRARWVRKARATEPETAPATTPAPTVGKLRKRERTAKKAKGTATTHMAEGATA
jgi:hypothetical protein